MVSTAPTPEDRARHLRELNAVLEMVEAGATDDLQAWGQTVEQITATLGGVTLEMLWLLSRLCGYRILDYAQCTGRDLDDLLQQARLEALDMVDGLR